MVSKSEPLAEGTVIMADDQFAGRGQLGNTWISKAGLNLTFSIYLRPTFINIASQFQLNIAVSVGLVDALKGYVDHGIKVKWPNDIYFRDQKIGGVLIENTLSSGNLKSSIIGIGINVNQQVFDVSKVKCATSLREILQQDVDLIKLLGEICTAIEREYLSLRSGRHENLKESYLSKMYRYQEEARYRDGNGVFDGVITGITDAGQLILEVTGAQRIYGFKEVEFII